jgi:hypothetical protein
MKKFVSGATCAAGPALTWWGELLWVAFPGGGGLGAAAPNYKINVMPVQPDAASDSWSFERLLVLEETTHEQPSLVYYGGKLWLAWTGTDTAHRLNLMPLTITADSHVVPGPKIVLDWTATGGPSLIEYDAKLYMGFSGGGGLGGAKPNGALNLAWSSDGTTWPSSQLQVLTDYHSLLSPSLAVLPQRSAPAELFIAFTGTNQLLYLVSTNGPGPRYLKELKPGAFQNDYPETSDFAPSLTLFFASANSIGDLSYVWTGSGNNRHLYRIAAVGWADLTQEHDAYSDTSAFSPSVVGVSALQYVAWAGTDAAHRLNIGEISSLTKIEGP